MRILAPVFARNVSDRSVLLSRNPLKRVHSHPPASNGLDPFSKLKINLGKRRYAPITNRPDAAVAVA
jgi:hypothetical protein